MIFTNNFLTKYDKLLKHLGVHYCNGLLMLSLREQERWFLNHCVLRAQRIAILIILLRIVGICV